MSPSDPPVAAPTPPYCHGCAQDLPVLMLDDNGCRTDISKRPGVPSHAVDDAWWPCAHWQRVAAPTPETPSQIPTASREFATLAIFEQPPYSEPDWAADGSPAISPKAIEAARAFFRYAWAVVPCMDGGVQLERHNLGFDMEIRFDADGRCDEAYAELAGAVSHPQPDPRTTTKVGE